MGPSCVSILVTIVSGVRTRLESHPSSVSSSHEFKALYKRDEHSKVISESLSQNPSIYVTLLPCSNILAISKLMEALLPSSME